jgi:LmbE family N-acetylglucosaminyl deacetylase
MKLGLASTVTLLAACGDNYVTVGGPLERATDLTIIAHQDDDLLFMQPDLEEAIRRGTGVTNVYVTAGNGRNGSAVADERYNGLMAAYGAIAGAGEWSCGSITLDHVGDQWIEHCRLAEAKISLVFLAYPDGGKMGEFRSSLLRLWQGVIDSATTVSHHPSTYRRDDLVAMLAAIIDATEPQTIRTLEVSETHGRDHVDHSMVGALATVATAASSHSPELISYRGYNTADEKENAAPKLLARALEWLSYYEACTDECAPCGQACPIERIPVAHLAWIKRRFAIGMRRAATGQLRIGDRCLHASATSDPMLGDCASAPSWQLDALGALRTSPATCLAVQPDGAVVSAACGDATAGPTGRFFLDDDGHLWSGVVPPPGEIDMLAHLYCLTANGDRPRAAVCGVDSAPVWQLARTATSTARVPGPPSDPSDASLVADLDGDLLPDWCDVTPAGPMCGLASDAELTPDGVAWGYSLGGRVEGADDAASQLAPVLRDVDGDGRADLCTVRDDAIVCARSLRHGFAPRTVLARLPAGMQPTELSIEPGGTPSAPRLCVADAVTLACTEDAVAFAP